MTTRRSFLVLVSGAAAGASALLWRTAQRSTDVVVVYGPDGAPLMSSKPLPRELVKRLRREWDGAPWSTALIVTMRDISGFVVGYGLHPDMRVAWQFECLKTRNLFKFADYPLKMDSGDSLTLTWTIGCEGYSDRDVLGGSAGFVMARSTRREEKYANS